MSRPTRKPRAPRSPGSGAPVIRFLVLCLLYWAVALLVLSRIPAVEEFGINLTVSTISKAFAITGQHVTRVGSSLYAGGEGVSIVSDCSPHAPFLIFAAVVLAFPSTWRQRLLGLAVGAVGIHVFNTVRIIVLMQILIWRPAWFEFAHVYLWQTGTVLMLFVTFALWLRWLGPVAKRAPRPAAS